ncbi:histone-lysine N-methyltransferase SUVR5 isoform X1 [Canna indica]|uniref:Histone-lysine N-methyltransferase SUVR5 isoform X1 n=1 Tax=Canna indica TaxID=4628 RepID=A0AAQ3Q7B2_9LILI|nr:histone-lysine N-methyltransferase SUVR5 isoform X1 [Canna indica]
MVEEPTFPRADCQQPRPTEQLLFTNCDRKQASLIVDFAQKGHGLEQIFSEKDDNLNGIRTSPHCQTITLLNSMHADGLQQRKVDEELTYHHKENANYSTADNHLDGFRVSNFNSEEADPLNKEGCNNTCSSPITELYSTSACCLTKVSDVTQDQQAELMDGLEPNGCNSTEDSQWGKADGARVGSMRSADTHISHSNADKIDQPCLLNELTSLGSVKFFEPYNMHIEGKEENVFLPSHNHPFPDKMDCNLHNENQEEDLGAQGNKYNYLEQDHAVALWVKWGGKWQTGIRCPLADCPLSALRAKPTHERKRYIPVFFPRGRTYSWADLLLVRSIDELPEPLLRGTHRRWRKLVKDLTLPHRHIMQKLAVAMLDISDRLHTEAVIENARKVTAWKDFAMEASQCRDYTDLGRMLLKLQTMILPHYMSGTWLESSFGFWKSKCQNAQSAESIETLTEELIDAILWVEVNNLWNAPMQPELGLEWKTWKQEAIRLFFSLHPAAISGDTGSNNGTNSLVTVDEASRKRPKLEIRRAETCVSQIEAPAYTPEINVVEAESRHCNRQEVTESTLSQPCKVEEISRVIGPSESHVLDKSCNGLVDVSNVTKGIQNAQVSAVTNLQRGMGGIGVSLSSQNESEVKMKYRQCLAFVLSKGRQCGRWASDGDIYCCVHLNAQYAEKLSQEALKLPVEAPMCEGTTTHGTKCKHHARQGSTFCKKHQLLGSHGQTYDENHSSGNALRENNCENLLWESSSTSNTVRGELLSPEEIQTSHENLVPVVIGVTLDERNCLMKKSDLYNALPAIVSSTNLPRCVGSCHQGNDNQCQEYATRHTLYCEEHIPKFLKRARNGKSRLVSKDIFLNLLKNCNSRKEKLCLHQACELLYGFMKNGLSRQRPVSRDDTIAWILSEASKDQAVGEFLLKLVSSERDKLCNVWGFNLDKNRQKSSLETKITVMPMLNNKDQCAEPSIKCKICAQEFADDHKLGIHWTQFHKKEARWLFRGYACAVCMTSFTNKKVLEAHVKERHGVQFLEHSTIFRCMPCNSHFVSSEQLWQHILSSHTMDFRLPDLSLQSLDKSLQPKIEIENHDDSQKLTCKFCGMKFDVLPDLGRHHQVAHMNPNPISQCNPKRGNYHLKRSKHCYPRLKKKIDSSFSYKNRISFDMQKHFKSSHSVHSVKGLQNQPSESLGLGQLLDIHCSGVAETLFSEVQETKPRPSNPELLSIARSACCRNNFNAALEVKYGILQENVYLKALKLCSELNIQVGWHLEGFICPKGCKPRTKLDSLAPLEVLKPDPAETPVCAIDPFNITNWEMDESHYILNLEHINSKSTGKAIILCEDVSFGREPVPVACVVDEHLKDSFPVIPHEVPCSQELSIHLPWKAFNYVTKRLIGPSLDRGAKDLQLGCKCPDAMCNPKNCDHVYPFNDDQTSAKDFKGNLIHRRFAYDEKGRIVVEEGRPVYECNSRCKCGATCPNRVLQRGVQVKLEIFRTEKKGWAVRAVEAISRGTFVCEYIGEVLNDEEAKKKGERYSSGGCSYLYDIGVHANDAQGLIEGEVPYMIDASKYGNVARFINHSCSPNLVNYLVLVENMDFQLAHIGLYASRDIAIGEELAYDYLSKLIPGDGHPCHCGTSNCRGRLY